MGRGLVGRRKGRRRREKGRIVVRGGLRSEGYASLSTGLGEPSSPPDARNNEVSDISELDRRTDHRYPYASTAFALCLPGAHAAHSSQQHSKRKSSGKRGADALHMTGSCLHSLGCMTVPNYPSAGRARGIRPLSASAWQSGCC